MQDQKITRIRILILIITTHLLHSILTLQIHIQNNQRILKILILRIHQTLRIAIGVHRAALIKKTNRKKKEYLYNGISE